MQPQVQNSLYIRRKEYRQPARLENMITLVRGSGTLAQMIVARDREYTPQAGGACHVGMLEHIRAAVNAGAFAVPDAKNAVVFFAHRIQIELLGAPNGGRRQLFVDAGLKYDLVGLQVLACGHQSLVVDPQWRATVATDKTRRVQPGQRIPLTLQQRQAHQRLHTTHEGASVFQGVFVVQCDRVHGGRDRIGQRSLHDDGSARWGKSKFSEAIPQCRQA